MTVITYAIATALFFALTFFLRKQALATIPILSALTIEAFIELVILLIVGFVSKAGLPSVVPTQGIWYAVLAGVFVVLGVGANFLALKSGALSKVISITSPSQIIFGTLLGVILLRDVLTVKQIAGTVLSIIGILLLVT